MTIQAGTRPECLNYHDLMKKRLACIFGALSLVTPLLLAQINESESAKPSPPAELAEAKAAQEAAQSSLLNNVLFYQLLVGEITVQEGEPAAGFALLLDAARKTSSAQLYQRATEIALQSRSGDAALQAAQAWKQDQPASRDANRYVLQILIALNRISDTIEPLQTEIRLAPDAERSQVLGAVPSAYARVNDKKLASATIEEALAIYLVSPATTSAAWTTVGRMRLLANDNQGALEAAQRGQVGNVRSEGPALISLDLMETKPVEAGVLIRKYLDSNATAMPEIRMGYARTLLEAQRYAEATDQLHIVTREKPELSESWLILGSLQLQQKQLSEAQLSLERYIALVQQKSPEDERKRGLDQAYLLMSQLFEGRKDYTTAESWLNKIDNSSELAMTQSRRASILASQGKLEQGRQLIRQLPERDPADARLKVSTEAGLLREFKQYKLAYEVLAQALVKMPNDPELLYDQAMMAEKLVLLDEMEQLLRQVIQLKPDYYHAYNALGYSLADRGIRLPEAKELIQKALTFAPADPFIKDSLGWVEFRMGNKAEAINIFDSAYKAKPDSEIAAHYGEVLWSMEQREQAMKVWKEGLLMNPDNETLLETLKRLRVKL